MTGDRLSASAAGDVGVCDGVEPQLDQVGSGKGRGVAPAAQLRRRGR